MKEEWVQGAPLHSHTTSYAGTRAFMQRRVRIALYNRLFAQSIVTRRRGVCGEIPPWGKWLIKLNFMMADNGPSNELSIYK